MIAQTRPQSSAHLLAQLGTVDLDPIVSQALNEPASVATCRATLLGGLDSSPMAGGVYQVAGTALTREKERREWAVVVKILRSAAGMLMPDGTLVPQVMIDDRQGFAYWRREALAAQSDLFDHLPEGLRTPRFLGITAIDDNACWLWQELLDGDAEWNWQDYGKAAYHLGLWQGIDRERHPNYPWLSRTWLAGWVDGPLTRIFGLVEGANGYDHPLVTAYFAPEELAELRGLWANRQRYLDRLAQLPATMCHLDAHRGNLSWQGGDLALFDWAFVGEGALGEELAAFVGATLLLDYVSLADAELLEQVAFAGYVAGLRAAGWSGDEALIEEAYRCALPLRFAPPSLASMLRTVVQPEFAAEWECNTGKSLADILAHRAGLVRFYLSRMPAG